MKRTGMSAGKEDTTVLIVLKKKERPPPVQLYVLGLEPNPELLSSNTQRFRSLALNFVGPPTPYGKQKDPESAPHEEKKDDGDVEVNYEADSSEEDGPLALSVEPS